MPSPAASVATQICASRWNSIWRCLRSCGLMPPWIVRGREAPLLEVLDQVVERVLVLGEDQQLPATVLELGELGPLEAALERFELGLLPVAACLVRARRAARAPRPPREAAPASRRRPWRRSESSCCSSVSSSISLLGVDAPRRAGTARASSRARDSGRLSSSASMSANRLWRRPSELVIAPSELARRRWNTMRASATLVRASR